MFGGLFLCGLIFAIFDFLDDWLVNLKFLFFLFRKIRITYSYVITAMGLLPSPGALSSKGFLLHTSLQLDFPTDLYKKARGGSLMRISF